MVTELLHYCGFGLGKPEDMLPPSVDNPSGYWENGRIVGIDIELLRRFGGSWDAPPTFPANWEQSSQLDDLRQRAKAILPSEGSFAYKDPRTCLTLPFWRDLIPDQKFVVVVRHPDEVAQSLTIRKQEVISRELGLRLFEEYYRPLLPLLDDPRAIVTHNLGFFYDPESELRRVLTFLEVPEIEAKLPDALGHIRADLRNGFVIDQPDGYFKIPDSVMEVYHQFCGSSGPVFERLSKDEAFLERATAVTAEKALKRLAKLERLYVENFAETRRLGEEFKQYREGLSKPERAFQALRRKLRGRQSR